MVQGVHRELGSILVQTSRCYTSELKFSSAINVSHRCGDNDWNRDTIYMYV